MSLKRKLFSSPKKKFPGPVHAIISWSLLLVVVILLYGKPVEKIEILLDRIKSVSVQAQQQVETGQQTPPFDAADLKPAPLTLPVKRNTTPSYQIHKSILYHTTAGEAGVSATGLSKIDSIISDAIQKGAMPGAQVFVAYKGKIIYEKAFGHHDYSMQQVVRITDLYDVASITKIAATTLAAMKLFQDSLLKLNVPLNYYVEGEGVAFKTSIYNLLTHQSGLDPSLPISPYISYTSSYQKLKKENPLVFMLASLNRETESHQQPLSGDIHLRHVQEVDNIPSEQHEFASIREEAFNFFFTRTPTGDFSDIAITEHMYLKNQFKDSLLKSINALKTSGKSDYFYADINMILLQLAIEKITGTDLDTYLKREFYHNLGMAFTTFNPLSYFPTGMIVPTEEEKAWRGQLIHGTVHDPSAALLGGIAGNAGLFSNATDLGILGQMLLNGGSYNQQKYLDKSTVDLFTATQPGIKHGLGFKKPLQYGTHARSAPPETFGHTGFTGTAMWIDPENEIVFVFLSNRINPTSENLLINTLSVREKVHQAVYDALLSDENIYADMSSLMPF